MEEINYIEIGRQLRKPDGEMGIEIGEKMNSSNNTMYNLVFSKLELKKGFNVLEIGYGNGKFIPDYFNICPDIKVAGVDFSDTMFAQAVENNKDLIQQSRVLLKCEDAMAMSFPNDTFDVVVTINTVYFWKDAAAQMKEIKRVLKKGGRLYIGYRPKEVMQNLPFIEEHFTLFDPEDLENLMITHQFRVIENKSQTISRTGIDGAEIVSMDNCLIAEKI
jgi:ubiquinone/menaquinone biosynthesis C-methylase UbiE